MRARSRPHRVRELDEVTRRYYEETGLWESRGWVGGYEMGIAFFPDRVWCRWADSNRRPTDYESVALPTELHRRVSGRGVYRISRRQTVRRTDQAGRD